MTSKPQLEAAPGKPSQIIDHQMRTWRLCLKCDVYQLTEDAPLTCPACQIEYGKTERTVGAQTQMIPTESRRATLCEACGNGFLVLTKDWNPAADEICEACIETRNTRETLQVQLKSARAFGNTEDVQVLENELDNLNGYNWREVHDRVMERRMRAPRPLPWTPAGG